MNVATVRRLGPLSGILAAAMFGVGAALSARGGYFPTAEEAHDFITNESPRVLAGTILGGFYGAFFLIWFTGTVAAALRKAEARTGDGESPTGALSTIALGGGIVAALGLTLSSAVLWVAAARVDRPGGLTVGEAVVLYDAYTTIGATVISIGLAAWIGATGLASLETKMFPAWLGWTSIAFAVGLLSPVHYIFEGLAAAWIVAVSALLYRQQRASTASLAPVAPKGRIEAGRVSTASHPSASRSSQVPASPSRMRERRERSHP